MIHYSSPSERRTRALIAIALATTIGLAGCASEPPAEQASNEPAPSLPSSTPEVPEPSAPAETHAPSTTPPTACLEYEGTAIAPPPGAEALQAALEGAPLPTHIAMNPGVQIVTSTDRPGTFEAVVRICSDTIQSDELKTAATGIAVATKADPSSDLMSRLTVSGWSPDSSNKLQQGETVSTQYQTYTWDDQTSGVPLDNNWD